MVEFNLVIQKMGEGILEVVFNSWLIDEGSHIEAEQVVASISTDKIDNEIISPIKGKLLKKLATNNQILPIGSTVAILLADEKDISEEYKYFIRKPEAAESPQKLQQYKDMETNDYSYDSSKVNKDKEYFISPIVKKMINENGITKQELDELKLKCFDNKVTKKDIENFLKSRHIKTINYEIKKMNPIRKKILDNMVKSVNTSVHVTSFAEADFTNLINLRNRVKDDFFKKNNLKLSISAFVIKAVAKAIKNFPMINISVKGDDIVYKKDINIGVATPLPNNNLIVPVIKNADTLSLEQIVEKMDEFKLKSKNNDFLSKDLEGGTYTISNIGVFGNIAGTPIINQPQVAILAIGEIVKKPVVIQENGKDTISIRSIAILSHSYDHRVIDGYIGCSFLKKVSNYIHSYLDINY